MVNRRTRAHSPRPPAWPSRVLLIPWSRSFPNFLLIVHQALSGGSGSGGGGGGGGGGSGIREIESTIREIESTIREIKSTMVPVHYEAVDWR